MKCSPPATKDRARGRTPHGVRGLKLGIDHVLLLSSGRTPHGVRGLKYVFGFCFKHPDVAPRTGCVD